MEIKTVTTRTTVLTLTDDEVEHYIDYPEEFALDLIRSGNRTGHIGKIDVVAPQIKPAKPAAKRGHYKKRAAKTPNWATNGDAGHKARGAAVKHAGTSKCAGCGKKMKVQGLGPHHKHCPEYQLKQAGIKANQQVLSGVE